ncbi:MAG TPA: hypothetical protein ENN99_03930 [Chloroflexi bacterium]|nr:hypothetical protein [Chloroflexota bacterium]
MDRVIVLLTGGRGVGKTTVCRETVALAQARGYTCGGLLTLTRADGGRDVVDVGAGVTRRLSLPPYSDGSGTPFEVTQGRFLFAPDVLAWGSQVLAQSVRCHLLVVDELGPLEIERGQGWARALDVLPEQEYALALVVVRTELVDRVERRLHALSPTVVPITRQNRDGLPRTLLARLESLQAAQSLLERP